MNCSDLCSIGMKEGNLSPPVLAKNKGTEVFRLVSAAKARLAGACPKYRPIIHRSLSLQWLQFLASKRASLTGACPIPCLYCIGASIINEHSPFLRRSELSESVSTFQTYSSWQILIFFLYIFSSSFKGYPQFLAIFLKNHARGRKGSSKSKKNRRIRKAVS